MTCYTFDIEIHHPTKCTMGENWVQAKYLVHGWGDVYWTDDIEKALTIIRESLEKASDTIHPAR